MTSIDKASTISPVTGLNIQVLIGSTTADGEIIDTKGFESLDFSVLSGNIGVGDFNVQLEHGEDSGLSDATLVPTGDLIGSLPVFDSNDDTVVKHVGYAGKKRFIRLQIVTPGSVSGLVGVIAILGNAKQAPTVLTPVPTT